MIAGTRLHYLQERVIFGKPAATALAAEADRVAAHRVFLVSSRWLGRDAPFIQGIVAALGDRFAGAHAGISAQGPKQQVVAAANLAREAGADLLVAIGGGSVIDGTKVMLRCLWNNISDAEDLVPNRVFGAHVVPGLDPTVMPPGAEGLIRAIAIPTTCSAAEYNFGGSVLNPETRHKEAHAHPLMVPRSVILDPAATQTVPVETLLSTGLKVLITCIARFCVASNNMATELAAREVIASMPAALRAIAADPTDLDPRMRALLFTWWTREADFLGVYGSAGSALTQAMGQRGTPDGIAGIIAMRAAFRWNTQTDPGRAPLAAALLGGDNLDAILSNLCTDLNQPTCLRDVGVNRADFPAIAAEAMHNAQIKGNPRPVESAKDLEEILELAW